MSYSILPRESVVADMIFLVATMGSSESMILLLGEGFDLLIFFSGFWRSRMRIPSLLPVDINLTCSLGVAGRTKISPNL